MRGGAEDWGESNDKGHNIIWGTSIGGMTRRMIIIAPHTAAVDPPPLRPILPHRTPLIVNDVVDRGQRQRHKGVRGVVVRAVKEEEVRAVVLGRQVSNQPGVDNRGKRSNAMLVGLRGQQHQAGEGGGVGAAPQGRQQQRQQQQLLKSLGIPTPRNPHYQALAISLV